MSSVVFINKDGFAMQQESSTQVSQHKMHTSSLFLRRSFKLKNKTFGGCVIVPPELPLGVQLRVASICLFRNMIRQESTEFFHADPRSSQVTNIRPHVVSLMFRSLTSESKDVVAAAESALRDILALKEHNEDEEDPKSQHKLPRELIQACLRSVDAMISHVLLSDILYPQTHRNKSQANHIESQGSYQADCPVGQVHFLHAKALEILV